MVGKEILVAVAQCFPVICLCWMSGRFKVFPISLIFCIFFYFFAFLQLFLKMDSLFRRIVTKFWTINKRNLNKNRQIYLSIKRSLFKKQIQKKKKITITLVPLFAFKRLYFFIIYIIIYKSKVFFGIFPDYGYTKNKLGPTKCKEKSSYTRSYFNHFKIFSST